jgi:hypothetical protein
MAAGAMKYQGSTPALQAGDAAVDAQRLSAANINPTTGLASDYLNHFHEAIMLLEMLPSYPDCRDDFLQWRIKSYAEHFAGSHFKDHELVIAAYDAAANPARECLDALADIMSIVLEATRSTLARDMPEPAVATLAADVAAWLRPLVVRAGAAINGDSGEPSAPQAVADALMRQ